MDFLSLLPLKSPALQQSLTLHQKVDDDGIEATSVGGCAGVIARVLSLHSAKQQCAICVDEPVSIQGHGDCRVFTARRGGGMGYGTNSLVLGPSPQCGGKWKRDRRKLAGDLGFLGLWSALLKNFQ